MQQIMLKQSVRRQAGSVGGTHTAAGVQGDSGGFILTVVGVQCYGFRDKMLRGGI